ncbi:MAG: hypothetical protein VCC04_11370 [Myxococcota bacterium]
MMIRFGARGDLKNKQGLSAAAIMARKRAPQFRKWAQPLDRAADAER